jgi:hypothetical protein
MLFPKFTGPEFWIPREVDGNVDKVRASEELAAAEVIAQDRALIPCKVGTRDVFRRNDTLCTRHGILSYI